MKSEYSSFGQRTLATASRYGRSLFEAILVTFACLALFNGVVMAQKSKTPAGAAPEKKFEDFNPNNFSHSTQIDNEWMPLKPGVRYVYAGTTLDDNGKPVPHRFVVTVTDLTKVISGVHTVVSWDLDYSAGDLVEAELAFYAQDNDGNVWRIGEYPEEYENGKFAEAPCWLHGFEEAKAGIEMKAKPQVGTPSYSQGWAPATGFADRAQVYKTGQKTCVPMNCYEEVLVTSESNPEEPGAEQYKYFARGVGNVRVGWKGEGEKTKETLELVDVMQLGPEALAEVRAQALELEKHAYEISKNVYAHTSPAEPTPGADGK